MEYTAGTADGFAHAQTFAQEPEPNHAHVLVRRRQGVRTETLHEHPSDRVVVGNIPNYIVDSISVGGSVTLTPHEIARNLVRMAPFHPFQLRFNTIPPQYFGYVPQLLDRQSYVNG